MPTAAFTPTEAQLKEILARGPYTEPLEDVYPMLNPEAVRHLLCPHASPPRTPRLASRAATAAAPRPPTGRPPAAA